MQRIGHRHAILPCSNSTEQSQSNQARGRRLLDCERQKIHVPEFESRWIEAHVHKPAVDTVGKIGWPRPSSPLSGSFHADSRYTTASPVFLSPKRVHPFSTRRYWSTRSKP